MYNNLSMTWKVVSLLLALGLVSLAGGYYASSRLMATDQLYSDLIDGPQRAVLELSRANRMITETMAGVYQGIAATTAEEGQRAQTLLSTSSRQFQERISAATGKAAPEYADRVRAIGTDYAAILSGACAEAIALSKIVGDEDANLRAGKAMSASCRPALRGLGETVTTLNATMGKAVDTLSDDATLTSIHTATVTLVTIALATLVVLALAVLLVRRGIVAPIRVMMTVTKGLGQGKLDQAVAGTERKDEIGAMAGSLEVLRGQLSEAEALRRAQAEREAREREILNRRNTLAENFVARMTELSSALPPPPIRWPAPPATSPPPPSRPPAKPRRSRKPPKRPPSMCRRSPLRRKNSRPRCGRSPVRSATRPRWRMSPTPKRRPPTPASRNWRPPPPPSAM